MFISKKRFEELLQAETRLLAATQDIARLNADAGRQSAEIAELKQALAKKMDLESQWKNLMAFNGTPQPTGGEDA